MGKCRDLEQKYKAEMQRSYMLEQQCNQLKDGLSTAECDLQELRTKVEEQYSRPVSIVAVFGFEYSRVFRDKKSKTYLLKFVY